MKILFVSPKHGRSGWEFPHAFAFLTSYVKRFIPDIKVDYVDINLQSMEELQEIYSANQHDIIALTGLTSHYASVKELVQFFKENKDDKTKIFVGGAIVSSYPEFMIQHLGADYYVLGEGEEPFVECIEAIAENRALNEIKNLGYLDDKTVVINQSRPLLSNLDELPWQDFETFGFSQAMEHNGYSALIFASRGCPFNCGFCYRLYGAAYRTRSVESVLDEMEFLIKQYNVYRFSFADELFFLKKSKVEKFCHELLRKNWGITWACLLRANLVEPNMLKLMKKAGCMQISYGIESGSQRMLERMNKRTTVEQNINALKITVKAGIFPGVNLIIGYPGETKQSIKETERMLDETCCHGGIHFIQALPGTALYKEVRDAGYIEDEEKYFLSLQREILGLPMDFTGLGKQFIEDEQGRITKKVHRYYVRSYNKFRWECFKYYLLNCNTNYLKLLPCRVVRGIIKRCGKS